MAPHAALAEIGVGYRLVEIDRDVAQGDAAYRRTLALPGVRRTLDEQGLDLPAFATSDYRSR